jgi:hypothetical protein
VVPYPRRGYLYGIKWNPPPARKRDGASAHFGEVAIAKGDTLAKCFHDGLAETALRDRCTVNLYVPDARATRLVPVGAFPPNAASGQSVGLYSGDEFLVPAWRGAYPVALREDAADTEASELGFRAGESALLALPVRFSLSWTNDAPWGVIRLGVRNMSEDVRALLAPSNATTLKRRLLWPMILMLAESGVGTG